MSLPMPTVRITEDCMEAYMTVPPTGTPENYTVEYLTDVLHLNHVRIGILTENLQKIIDNNIYNKEVLVAKGAEAQDGKDGYFEYLFETNLSQKPIVLEDGTVDYKNGKLHGPVEEWYNNGQLRWRSTFKNGKLHGLYEEWDRDGKLIEGCTYKDGIKVSDNV